MTTCKLRTVETEMPLNIADQMHTKKVNQIIMHAGLLKDALGELDWSADAVEVVLSQSEPYFKLSTNGKAGSSAVNRIDALLRRSFSLLTAFCWNKKISYPKDCKSFSSFSVKSEQKVRYPMALLQPAQRGLSEATSASLRTNTDGLLLIQMSIDLK